MSKTGVKRKVSDLVGDDDTTELPIPRHPKKLAFEKKSLQQYDDDSEQVVKEFIKLMNVKQTRLKGLIKFLKELKKAETLKCKIIAKYLQSHPDCVELFKVLEERMEERSLLEVQLVLEILETIILQLADEDIRLKSKSTVIISTFFSKNRKLVYNVLNSSSPAKVATAMLKFLTSIVMQGSTVAKELLTTFDFSHKTFSILVNRRDKKDVSDVRTCFIKFLLSFFVSGDPSLIQQVLQIKGFATSIFKNLCMDSPEVIHLVLSTLLVQIVQNSVILKKTKILLFTSYSLTQLVKLYSYDKDSLTGQDVSVCDQVHNFLLELCTLPSGIAFENKLGIFSSRSNNPVLLRFLNCLPKTLGNDFLVELVIKTLIHSQDLVTPYLLDCQMALEPRNSQQWSKNFLFLIKLYVLLPMPSVIVNNSTVLPENPVVSKFISLVCPLVIKRNILTKGLLHSDFLVQTTTLNMVNIILRRSVDLVRCTNVNPKILTAFQEDVLKVLPSLQTLISIRENLLNKTKKTEEVSESPGNESTQQDSSPRISSENAMILLSRTLVAMSLYQSLWRNGFTQTGYDPWKILPRNEQEQQLYNLSSQHSMLHILLNSPSRNFKWRLQPKGETFQGLYQILTLYCTSKNVKIQNLSGETVKRLFFDTGVFAENKNEIHIWLRSLLDDCIEKNTFVIKFLEKVYNNIANDPCDFVDVVLDCINVVTATEAVYPTKSINKKTMPFSPFIAGALKLFGEVINNREQQKEMAVDIGFVARFLNLILLDLLSYQSDPRPLYNIVTKYLTQDGMVTSSLPVQTKAVIYYIRQLCSRMKDTTSLDKTQPSIAPRNIRNHQGKEDEKNKVLLLKEFKKQLGHLPDDIGSVVTFLKYNPVLLLDYSTSTDLVMVLNNLPCSLILHQLLMFLLKYWDLETEIADMVAFEQLSTALLSSAKHDIINNWDRVVTGCLFILRCLIQLYLNNSENQTIFTEINRIIVEVLRIILNRVWENKKVNEHPGSPSTSSKLVADEGYPDVTSDADDVTSDADDVTSDTDDVTSDVDDVSETLGNQADTYLECLQMVFGHFVFKNWFCHHVGRQTDKTQFTVRCVSSVVSDCVLELINDQRSQILSYSEVEFWKPYFLRITDAVKAGVNNKLITDMILPFNVDIVSLVEIFRDRFPAHSLREIVLSFLEIPEKELVKCESLTSSSEEQGNILTEKGKTLMTVLDCFLSNGKTCLEICTTEELERIFDILTCIDSQETDELIAKSVTIFSSISDQINHTVLLNCLDHASRMRIETVVILLSCKPSVRSQFEQLFVNIIKERKKESREATNIGTGFLEVTSQWELFLPLLNFYLSSVLEGEISSRSKRTRNCVKYISKVSWAKLNELLLNKKSRKCSRQHFLLTLRLLQLQDSESDTINMLFTDAIKQEHLVHWNVYNLQMVEALLQFLLKQSSNEKHEVKHRTIFVFTCMQKITSLPKSTPLEGQENLRLKMLDYLENYGKRPLKLKANDHFTNEDFINVTNMFIKSALRSYFSCALTLRVLGVVIKTVYQCGSKKCSLLIPLPDLYQFILSHSKFLEIFLANCDDTKHNSEVKCALVDLLQTVVDLDPKCCHHSHVLLILGAYSAKLRLTDQKLLCLLFSYEAAIGELAVGSQVLWGEAAIEGYESNKNNPSKLWHQPNIVQVLELLDSKLLLQSAKHFPIHRQLQPVVSTYEDVDSQWYDPCFLLPLFSFFMASNCEVNCRRFVDRCALAYTISALTSTDEQMRQVAYQILSRFLIHLSASRFREKQQVSHLLNCFQNGILEPNSRLSSLITSFMARALHIFFYPEDPLYVGVNSYMLQKAFLDLRDVPLFLSLINSSDLGYRTERTWLLHLLIDGLRDSMDYYCCKKYHVFQQLFSLYNCSIADKYLQKLILKVIRQVSGLRAPVYDLCHNYGLVPWLHMLVTSNSVQRDTFYIVLDILPTIWFTLIGQEVSHHNESKSNVVDTNENPLPKNICPELLLVCMSVLQKNESLEILDQNLFLSFVRLLASLLDHQDNMSSQPKITLSKEHAITATRIWNRVFSNIDLVDKLVSLLNWDPDLSSEADKVTSTKWFRGMISVSRILKSLSPNDISEHEEGGILSLRSYSSIPKPVGKCVGVFVAEKLRSILRPFLEPAENYQNNFSDWRILRTLDLVT